MKFNKTVAIALANKVRKQLLDIRKQSIENYVVDPAFKDNLEKKISEYVETSKKCNLLMKQLKTITKSMYTPYGDDRDDIYNALLKSYINESVPKVPDLDDLIDDFIVESIDARDAEELMNKIISKYHNNE